MPDNIFAKDFISLKSFLLFALFLVPTLLFKATYHPIEVEADSAIVTGNLLEPLDIEFENSSWSDNPYDLVASATFIHTSTGMSRTTELFYAGNDQWKARFTAELEGEWGYTTSSSDADLSGLSGTINIVESDWLGFVETSGDKWIRSATGQAFVPQFVMAAHPNYFYDSPSKIDDDVALFIEDHGFGGLHVKVDCRWFDIYTPICTYIDSSDPNPDQRTFEALEQIILETYKAGGVVHIWVWGDAQRDQTPARWGYNGAVDQRLQRYIAARLGPMPGWTMGYGFDLFEWTNEAQLDSWHDYMQDHLGWPHQLGARSSKNQLDQLSEKMEYSGYEQHRPDYDKYVETLLERPYKPSFSEDRFRVRDEGRSKDYSLDDTRRGLWRSSMSGGVANIWGYLLEGGSDELGSKAYPNADQIKTYSDFFGSRYHISLSRCNELTDGVCLSTPSNAQILLYKESTSSIEIDLSGGSGALDFVAIDTISGSTVTGEFENTLQTWNSPYTSDWAIAIGDFCPLTLSWSDCEVAVPTPTVIPETATPTFSPTPEPVQSTDTPTPVLTITTTPSDAPATPQTEATATPLPNPISQNQALFLPVMRHPD